MSSDVSRHSDARHSTPSRKRSGSFAGASPSASVALRGSCATVGSAASGVPCVASGTTPGATPCDRNQRASNATSPFQHAFTSTSSPRSTRALSLIHI